MKRIRTLRHVPFEGPANIAAWAAARGHTMTDTRLYAGEPLPDIDTFDWLVVMGGPMGANDEREFAWMTPEKALVERTLRANKPVVGVCLGAQLIASVLGARVHPNTETDSLASGRPFDRLAS